MKKMNVKQLSLDAMLAAMCAVLGWLAPTTDALKISFESLPILFAAFMFGASDGLFVGAVGTLIYQLLKYGVSATTLLWIAPYALCGLLLGLYAERKGFALSRREFIAASLAGELLITALNTAAIYADSKIYGYYFPGLIWGALALRTLMAVAEGFVFGALTPLLLSRVKKALR